MQQDPKATIVNILTIIGYEDNKDDYAADFIKHCEQQALVDALTALPEEQQETLKRKMEGVTDQEQQKAIIAEYIPPEQYKKILQKASQTAFVEFMQAITPTVSTSQLDTLQSYLQSLKPTTTVSQF